MKKEELFQKLAVLQDRSPTVLGNFKVYSVLIPIVMRDNELHILFEIRSESLRSQPGEICFPGGRFDKEDIYEKNTAIRETSEELGIKEEEVSISAPLDYIVAPFGRIIYPFVGQIQDFSKINPNPDEVGEIFTVPLSFLLEHEPELYFVDFNVVPEKDFPIKLIPNGENYNWRARRIDEYFYYYEDKVIWGLTAKILKHFVDLIKGE